MINTKEIIVVAEKEFKGQFQYFKTHTISLIEAQKKDIQEIEKPGVYVYWKNGQVLKIGKSNTNVRKRACEHIRDNTTSKDGQLEMKDLANDMEVIVLFFVIKDVSKIHWVIALEDYLEHNLEVKIPSVRRN